MKKSHIIALVMIVVSGFLIFNLGEESSSYDSFATARERAKVGDSKSTHVVGKLKKDAMGEIVGLEYNPQVNPNLSKFILVDTLQQEEMVTLYQPLPPDLAKSDRVVVIGKFQNDKFIADEVLLKCPSKYEETEVK